MKHYVLFINGKCFVEFRYNDRTVRKSLGIYINDKSKQAKLRRIIFRLITSDVNESNIISKVNTYMIEKMLS